MNKTKFTLIIIGIVCVFLGTLYWLVFTTAGSRFLSGRIISHYVDYEDSDFKNVDGTLESGLTFENLELTGIKNLPEGTTLRIQKIFLNLTSLNFNGLVVEVENARLRLPHSDPIVISGTFKQKELDFNIYSKRFTVNEVITYLPDLKSLIPIKGDVNDIDLFVGGGYLEPTVRGSFVIEKFIYKGFILANAPLSLQVQLKGIRKDIQLHGNVTLEEGELQTKRVIVKLGRGGLNFSGPWNEPGINLNGQTKVEKTKINIVLKGTPEKPDLTLTSEPPYSRQKLMVMLATGKSWQSFEGSSNGALSSAALTKDFVDYFFFAGKSNQFAKRFGISDFSVTFDENTKGVSAKKEITDKLEVGYGLEQRTSSIQESSVSQKVEGEYKLNERISVTMEREASTTQSQDTEQNSETTNNDKVLLKYKKSF